MTALGIGVTDRDPIFGWESVQIQPRHRSPREIAYREAADKADQMWRDYCHKVDSLLAHGNYAEINAEGKKCVAADKVARRLYTEWMEG